MVWKAWSLLSIILDGVSASVAVLLKLLGSRIEANATTEKVAVSIETEILRCWALCIGIR